MKEKIIQIRKAIEAGCYLPALALTLTLPDICGKVKYPEKKSGDRYKEWFNDYVKSPITNSQSNDKFDGKACYQLRCAFLHEGSFNQEKNNYIFKFHIDKLDKDYLCHHRIESENGKILFDLDVYEICKAIIEAAQRYYNEYERKEDFRTDKIIDETWSEEAYNKLFGIK